MFAVTNNKRKKLELYSRGLSMICFSGISAYTLSIAPKSITRPWHLKMLKVWNIQDAERFKEILDWLLSEGRRSSYNKKAHFLLAYSEVERALYLQSLPAEHTDKSDLMIVNYYLRRLPAEGIAAVDYGWCAYLCQAGLKLGYMTSEEYWACQLQIAQAAQRAYSGWSEYTASFAAGVQYVAEKKSDEYIQQNRPVLTKLLASRYSPFRQVDWNMELSL